jgi:hypothetical protein
MHDVRVAL